MTYMEVEQCNTAVDISVVGLKNVSEIGYIHMSFATAGRELHTGEPHKRLLHGSGTHYSRLHSLNVDF